jgi:hypothetical protein
MTGCAAQHAGAKRQPPTGRGDLQPALLVLQARRCCTELTASGPWFHELPMALIERTLASGFVQERKLNLGRLGFCWTRHFGYSLLRIGHGASNVRPNV